ncbi:hypothetical protein BJ996_007647 [Streptomyces phaeogriseichromatogenes]|nr:hypothetical protein [Streptomyces murinus]
MVARAAFMLTLVLAAVLLMTGCDDRKCLEGHTDLIPVTSVGPKGAVNVHVVPVYTCTKYEGSRKNG